MSFRPQFGYLTPAGSRDEQHDYYFASFNTPALVATLATLATIDNIPLLLEPDSEFHWRGIKVSANGGSSLAIKFQDPYGHFLSDDYVPVNSYVAPSGLGNLIGTQPVAVESEIICPPGGVVWISLQNPTAGAYTVDIAVTLFGVRRFQGVRCAT